MSEIVPLPEPLQVAIGEYESWINGELRNVQNLNKITQPTCHYTNSNGLKGIIDNHEIWFTDIRHLNDPSEFKFVFDLLKIEIKNYTKSSKDKNLISFMDFSLANLNFVLNDVIFPYVSCFSKLEDDLNQWRAYGDNGRGFCIVFSEKFFEDSYSENQNVDDEYLLNYVLPTNYDHDNSKEYYKNTINKAASIISKSINKNPNILDDKNNMDIFGRKISSLMILSTLWHAIMIKHPAYSAENEVRQIIIENKDRIRKHIKIRTRGQEIIPYISTDRPIHQENMVVRIIVGPAADQRAVDAVKALLLSKNMSWVDVIKSKIPYRSAYEPINSLDELAPFGSL